VQVPPFETALSVGVTLSAMTTASLRLAVWNIALWFLCVSSAFAQTTAFVGGRIIDGTGKVIDNGTVIARDGKIVQVGPRASVTVPAGAERIDISGLTLLPGLINAHGHLTNVVGMRAEQSANTQDHVRRQAHTYGRYGITSVFSLGEENDIAAAAFEVRAAQAKGAFDHARVFLSGPVISATTADAARATTDKIAAMKPDLLKIRVDDNLGSTRKMPEEAWRATIARAQELKLPVATHIFYLADAKAVLAAGSNVIAHSVRDVPVDDEFVKMMKSRAACYSPTLMREVSTYVYGSTPTWANDQFFAMGLGDQADAVKAQITDTKRQAEVQASGGYKQGLRYKEAVEVAKKNLKTLSDAGVLIAMGTDTGPAGRFQGFFEHLELEMMVDAGLTPMQVLVAATGDAARCHGKAGQLGSIQPGAAADFLIVKGNPLQDIKATRAIQSVWVGGRKIN
jgi:imidazolonepropionase-like amidohydrolase